MTKLHLYRHIRSQSEDLAFIAGVLLSGKQPFRRLKGLRVLLDMGYEVTSPPFEMYRIMVEHPDHLPTEGKQLYQLHQLESPLDIVGREKILDSLSRLMAHAAEKKLV